MKKPDLENDPRTGKPFTGPLPPHIRNAFDKNVKTSKEYKKAAERILRAHPGLGKRSQRRGGR